MRPTLIEFSFEYLIFLDSDNARYAAARCRVSPAPIIICHDMEAQQG